MKLILASLSTTRRDMLEAAGIRFEAHSALLNEEKAKAELRGDGLAAHAVAKSLAELKALSIDAKGALVIGSDRLIQIRRNRLLSLNQSPETDYVDLEAVNAELAFARRLFADNGWPVIDVTRRSIEETAFAIVKLCNERMDAHA